MKILNVAEKPAMAKQISSCLTSHYTTSDGRNKFCKNYNFEYNLNGRSAQMVMTSVLGHVQALDFPQEFSNWQLTPPATLLSPSTAPVVKSTPEANRGIVRNLEEQARSADWLVIWTDCDREGEHIGSEIVEICLRVNRRMQVFRARYSAVTAGELRRAMDQLQRLDERQVAAVNVRSEIDLRTGACFTRFQTLKLQQAFPVLSKEVISYGSCQFPTLGFVVEQYFKVKRFTPESFWYLDLKVELEGISNAFTWKRGHLYDQLITLICYERCLQDPRVLITSVIEKPCTKYKPLPLRTVEFQKAASKFLKMSSDALMKIAERLYNQGYISYPRTETDVFEFSGEELKTLIRKQSNDPHLGPYATRLLERDFSFPRKGKNNDKAHPPIHPTSAGVDLTGPDRSVFEFITRRFLACCSLNAEGQETTVTAAIGQEEFECRGIRIVARNYLEVYVYDKWSEGEVAPFQPRQQLPFQSFLMQQGTTTAPPLLSEADLITCMDKNGIGTDATIHEHIQKLLLRTYALKHATRFIPTRLGVALVRAYDALGLEESLTQPKLRAALEHSLSQVCAGAVPAAAVLEQLVRQFGGVFGRVEGEFEGRMMPWFREYLASGQPFDPMDAELVGSSRGASGRGGSSRGSRRGGNDTDNDTDSDGEENNNDLSNRRSTGKRRRGGGSTGTSGTSGTGSGAGTSGTGRKKSARSSTGSTGNTGSAGNTRRNAGTNQHTPNATTQRIPNTTTTPSTTPDCNCGSEAVQKTVLKEGPNRGRVFWTCGKGGINAGGGGCDFFSWADSGGGSGNARSSNSTSTSTSNHSSSSANYPSNSSSNYSSSANHNKECNCGLLMIRGEFRKGPNAGRAFIKCPKIVGKCGAFEFMDGEGDGRSKGNARSNSNSRSNKSNTSAMKCFKCNQPGHFANACPQ